MELASNKHHGSIVYTLLKVIFATYCSVTILVTLFHLLAEYQDAKSQMVEKFHTLEAIFAPGMSQALWNLDEVQIASHLEGIMQCPIVMAVQLESLEKNISSSHNPLWSRGQTSEQSYPLSALEGSANEASSFFMNKRLEHHFYLYPPNSTNKQPIGQVTLHSEQALLLQEIQQSAFYIVSGALIKTLALWLFFLFYGNQLLRKPLKKLTQAVERINFSVVESSHSAKASLEGKNEFLLLEQSFNQMLERLRAENQAKNQLQTKNDEVLDFLDDIVTSMPVALIGINKSNIVQHWNPAAERLTGVTTPDAIGKSLCDILPNLKAMSAQLEMAKTQCFSFRSETFELKTSTETLFTRLTAYPLKNKTDESMVILIEDITESVLAEKSMVESDKVITLAGFSAGMAHDINNPLSIISQSAENLKLSLISESKLSTSDSPETASIEKTQIFSLIEAIQSSVKRMSDIVDNMLSFTRNNPTRLEPHDIKPIIEKSLEFIKRDPNINSLSIYKSINFEIDIDNECPQILSAPSHLQQALFNLLKNSMEALQQSYSGIVPKIAIQVSANKSHVILKIKDNGPGIAPMSQRNLFKPLTSTKGKKGTGLGLFICHSIITKVHQGSIAVTSSEEGAQFEIRLMRAKDIKAKVV